MVPRLCFFGSKKQRKKHFANSKVLFNPFFSFRQEIQKSVGNEQNAK
jgi:hypothetical protein